MQTVQGLDHVIVLARDLDASGRQFARLGFRVTPKGVHSAHMGTANATIVFRDRTYVETLTVLQPTPANVAVRAVLAEREGPHGLAFKTGDARAAASAFATAGIAQGGSLEFARPVELPVGTAEAAFTVARTDPGKTPGSWLFVCQHHTPDVVWRADFLTHPNGAIGVAEVIGIADDLDAIAERYGVIFGDRLSRGGDDLAITAGAMIRFLTPAAFAARFGAGAGEGALPRLAALRLEVADPGRARDHLEREGVPFEDLGRDGLRIAPSDACGTLLELIPAR